MRVRGLKYGRGLNLVRRAHVAPHAGAWIEMEPFAVFPEVHKVAPHAGAWIEIVTRFLAFTSHVVAPHAGAWIEIPARRA